MLHIQMKYTKYHRKKKNSANDKTCFLFSYNLLYHKLKGPVWVAFKGECKISPPPPPLPALSISINEVTLQATLKWNFAVLEVKTDWTM